jgi:hypothetical protein
VEHLRCLTSEVHFPSDYKPGITFWLFQTITGWSHYYSSIYCTLQLTPWRWRATQNKLISISVVSAQLSLAYFVVSIIDCLIARILPQIMHSANWKELLRG